MLTEQQSHDRPADTLRDGNLKATIWKNQGENGVYYTTTFARTYEDKNGKLQDINSFSGTDLLRVSELAREAYARSNELRRDLNQSQDRNASSRRDGGTRNEASDDRNRDDDDYDGGERRTRQDQFRQRRGGRSRSNSRSRHDEDQGGRRASLPDHDL